MVSIRISQAGACPRRIQLEAWGVEGMPVWEGTQRAFEEGNLHEASILAWASRNLPISPCTITHQQMEVKITDWLTGHIDALGINQKGKIYLIEAKCLSRRAFQELREKGVMTSHPQYYTQVQLYLHALRNQGWAVQEAYLVARDKETPKTRLWDHCYERITYDPTFVAEKIAELTALKELIERREEIPPPFHPEHDWHCRPPWCPYTYYCFPDWKRKEPEVVIREDLAPLLEEYYELSEEIATLEARRTQIKEQLLATVDSQPIQAGRWLVQAVERRQERFDTKLARKELAPDVLAKFLKVTTYRVLDIREAV